VERLPSDLGEALALLERSDLARETLGEQLCEAFVRNRRREWDAYRATVADTERKAFPELL
jgi:glutamine synthetase